MYVRHCECLRGTVAQWHEDTVRLLKAEQLLEPYTPEGKKSEYKLINTMNTVRALHYHCTSRHTAHRHIPETALTPHTCTMWVVWSMGGHTTGAKEAVREPRTAAGAGEASTERGGGERP